MKNQFRDEQGYFTVEASFIVPMVLFCMTGVLFLTLYLYDLGTAKSFLNGEVVQISAYPQKASKGKNRLEKELKKKLIVSKVEKLSFSAGQQKIKGSLQIYLPIPIPVVGELVGKLWRNHVTITVENGNHAEQMRRWSLVE